LQLNKDKNEKSEDEDCGLKPPSGLKTRRVSFQETPEERSVGTRFSEDIEVIPPSTAENETQKIDSEEQLKKQNEDANDLSTRTNENNANVNLTNINKGENEDDSEDENSLDIDDEIDDALDEGYMGMECTLERGFSLNESAIARDMRYERYEELYIDYHPANSYSRYNPALKHLIPRRKQQKNSLEIKMSDIYCFICF
ncbi:unnamed protein product, partial [Meganyctiphanes norvegica]